MDSKRFDAWTRNRALRLSRRDALRIAGVGGTAAMLPALQSNALAQGTCSLTVHAEAAGSVSAPAAYDGTLQFALGANDAFTRASFTTSAGETQSATGQATGRAIDFEVTIGGTLTLAFSGVGAQPIDACSGDVAGIFTDLLSGGLGAWQGTANGSASVGTTSSASTSSSSGSGSTGSSGSTGQSTLNCPSPQTSCGQNCCPGGATCTDANQGLCACPNDTEQCGQSCVPSCTDGQSLDFDSCTCPPPESACIQNQQTCQTHAQCCSGYCGGGTCFDCAGLVCGDSGCIDPSQDTRHCGACGFQCVYPESCINGGCGCAPDLSPCIEHSQCCTGMCWAGATCVACPDLSPELSLCGVGNCVDLSSDVEHCGACFNRCTTVLFCVNGMCM